MNIYLIIFYVLQGISLLMYANLHGKPKEGKWSFWGILITSIILTTIVTLAVMSG